MATSQLAIKISALVDGLANIDSLSQRLNTLAAQAQRPFDANTAPLEAGINSLNGRVDILTGGLTKARNLLVGFVATKISLDVFGSSIAAGVQFNSTIETAKLGIASLIAAQGELRSADGRRLEGIEAINAAEVMSEVQLRKLRVAGLQTAATFEQLSEAYQQAVGAGMNAGLNLDQVREVTIGITQAAQALGVPMAQLNQEVVSILNGTIDMNSRVGKGLQLSNEQVNSWKQQGVLADELNKKLAVFVAAGEKIGASFSASTSNLDEAFQTVFGTATIGLFDKLKTSFNAIIGEMIDTSTGRVQEGAQTMTDALSRVFDGIGDLFGSAVSKGLEIFRDVSQYIAENGDAIDALGAGLDALLTGIGEVVDGFIDLAATIATSGAAALTFSTVLDVLKLVLSTVDTLLGAFNNLPAPIKEFVVGAGLIGTVILPMVRNLINAITQMGANIIKQAPAVGVLGSAWKAATADVQRYNAEVAEGAKINPNANKTSLLRPGITEQGNLRAEVDAESYAKARALMAAFGAEAESAGTRLTTSMTAGQKAIGVVSTAVSGLGRLLTSPFALTIAIVGYQALKAASSAVVEYASQNNAAAKSLEASYLKSADQFKQMGMQALQESESLSQYAQTKTKSSEQLLVMGQKELDQYEAQIAKREKYYKTQEKGLSLLAMEARERIDAMKTRGADASTIAVQEKALASYTSQLKDNKDKLTEASQAVVDYSARQQEFAENINTGSLTAIKKLVKNFDDVRGKGKELSKALAEVTESLSPGKLTAGGVATVLNALRQLKEEGKASADQIKDSLVAQLKKLSSEDLLQFQTVATQAFDAAKGGAEGAANAMREMRTALEAAQEASFEKLGVDVTKASTGVSKGVQEIVGSLGNISSAAVDLRASYAEQIEAVKAKSAEGSAAMARLLEDTLTRFPGDAEKIRANMASLRVGMSAEVDALEAEMKAKAAQTSAALNEAFNLKVGAATTRAEIALISAELDRAAKAGTLFGSDLVNSQQKVADKTRELAGVIEGALGDSFRRLGLQGAQALEAVAEQALVDFDRIRASGLATNGELISGVNKYRDAAVAAHKNASTTAVELANAYTLVRTQVGNAAAGLTQAFAEFGVTPVNELKDSLANTSLYFERVRASGQLSAEGLSKVWQDYSGKVVSANGDVEGTFLRVKAAAEGVTLSINDSWGRMGVKTRAELQTLANQAGQDFQTISTSGQATSATLEASFMKYAEAAVGAAGGMDSQTEATLRAAAAAAGLGEKVDGLIAKFKQAGDASKSMASEFTAHSTGLGDAIGRIINSMTASIASVSSKAAAAFTGWLTGTGQAATGLSELEIRLGELETYLGKFPRDLFDMTGFGQALMDISRSAAQFEAEAIRDRVAVERLNERVAEGDMSLRSMANALRGAISGADTLDDATLNGLKSQLKSAQDQIESVRKSALGVVESLKGMGLGFKEEIMRAKGQLVELEEMQYQQKLKQLAETRDQVLNNKDADVGVKAQARAAYADAKNQLDDLHGMNMRRLREEMAAERKKQAEEKALADGAKRQAEKDAKDAPIAPEATAPAAPAIPQADLAAKDLERSLVNDLSSKIQALESPVDRSRVQLNATDKKEQIETVRVVEHRFGDLPGAPRVRVPEADSAKLLDILEEFRRRSS